MDHGVVDAALSYAVLCTTAAVASASKSRRLTEKVALLANGALAAMKVGDEAAARRLLSEKAVLAAALAKCQTRSEANHALALTLDKAIGAAADNCDQCWDCFG